MKKALFVILFLVLGIFSFSCNEKSSENASLSTPEETNQSSGKIVAFGDSLTAGLGLPLAESYPAFLQEILEKDGYYYEVVNAGVSGDTTTGGLQRIDWTLDGGNVKFVILELGGNDILRGINIELMQKNLAQIIERIQSRGAKVILAGIEAPTNSGPEYRKEVHQAYKDLADKYKVPFIPFFLEGIVGNESLIQEDGTHLTKEGNRVLAQNVYSKLQPLLRQAAGEQGR